MAPVIESGTCVRTLQMDYDDEVAYHGAQAICDLARKPDDKPFFVTVSFTSPHSPFVISNEHWDLYTHDDIELPTVPEIPLDEKDHLNRNLHYGQARHLCEMMGERGMWFKHHFFEWAAHVPLIASMPGN